MDKGSNRPAHPLQIGTEKAPRALSDDTSNDKRGRMEWGLMTEPAQRQIVSDEHWVSHQFTCSALRDLNLRMNNTVPTKSTANRKL